MKLEHRKWSYYRCISYHSFSIFLDILQTFQFPSFRVNHKEDMAPYIQTALAFKKAHKAMVYVHVYDVIIVQLYTKHESSLLIKVPLHNVRYSQYSH